MKKIVLLFAACSLLLCCQQERPPADEPEQNQKEGTVEPEQNQKERPRLEELIESYTLPCECPDEWPDQEPENFWIRAMHGPVYRDDLPWDYPIKPKTEEWNQFGAKERRDVLQIPEDILASLSTDDLAHICMKFPILHTSAAFSPINERGLDSLFKRFNGVRELIKRKDASKALLKWYKCAIQNRSFLFEDVTNVEMGGYVLDITMAELILSRYQLPDDADKDNYVEIVQHLSCGAEKMLELQEYFGLYALEINCIARAKIMFKIDEQIIDEIPQGFNNPLFTGAGYYGDDSEPYMIDIINTLIAIHNLSCRYIH